ncbi:MAG: CpaF family protein, partial [Elusimicrobia bacterium]|nr:CpaF family protein [Elusimicrobiota bacterium]
MNSNDDIQLNLQPPQVQNIQAFSIDEELDEHAAKLKGIELGPLKELMLYDDAVSDIMVNGPDRIFIEKHGKIELAPVKFESLEQLERVIDNILAPVGRHIGPEAPMVDARLPDGSRVNVVIPPISLVGPMISIRKYPKSKLTISDLLRYGSLSQEMAEFLKICVMSRKNIIIA